MLIAPKKEVDGPKLMADFKELFQKVVISEVPNRSLCLNTDGSIEIETQNSAEDESVIYLALRPTRSQITALLCN